MRLSITVHLSAPQVREACEQVGGNQMRSWAASSGRTGGVCSSSLVNYVVINLAQTTARCESYRPDV